MKKVIGITGGIASGKSVASNIIKKLGYPVIDADIISKKLSEKGNSCYNAIVDTFGEEYLLESKELDRKKLGKLIFNDSSKKELLNSITHPLILEEIERQISTFENGVIFLDIPLLYESKMEFLCDEVICVYVNKDLQIKRLMERDGIDREFAIAKINSQLDLEKKKLMADYFINSDNTLIAEEYQIKNIIDKIKGE